MGCREYTLSQLWLRYQKAEEDIMAKSCPAAMGNLARDLLATVETMRHERAEGWRAAANSYAAKLREIAPGTFAGCAGGRMSTPLGQCPLTMPRCDRRPPWQGPVICP